MNPSELHFRRSDVTVTRHLADAVSLSGEADVYWRAVLMGRPHWRGDERTGEPLYEAEAENTTAASALASLEAALSAEGWSLR